MRYDFRAALMAENGVGLTKTYNRFHDPGERAVLDAYGWRDFPTRCQFLLNHEPDKEEMSGRRRKPWRYRWPDTVRDNILVRLLALNATRAAGERLAGAAPGVRR